MLLNEELVSIGKKQWCTAGVDEDNILAIGEAPLAQLIDKAGEAFARIGGIDQNPLAAGQQADRVQRSLVGITKAGADIRIGYGNPRGVGVGFEADMRSGLGSSCCDPRT